MEIICKRYIGNDYLYGLNTDVSCYVAHHKIKFKCEQEFGINNHLNVTDLTIRKSLKVFPCEINFFT